MMGIHFLWFFLFAILAFLLLKRIARKLMSHQFAVFNALAAEYHGTLQPSWYRLFPIMHLTYQGDRCRFNMIADTGFGKRTGTNFNLERWPAEVSSLRFYIATRELGLPTEAFVRSRLPMISTRGSDFDMHFFIRCNNPDVATNLLSIEDQHLLVGMSRSQPEFRFNGKKLVIGFFYRYQQSDSIEEAKALFATALRLSDALLVQVVTEASSR